jgi:NifQ.
MSGQIYGWLMAQGGGDPFDRHLFACAISTGLADPARSLPVSLGLSAEALAALVGEFFPHAPTLLSGLDLDGDGAAPLTADEFALRDLLADNRSHDFVEEEWLSCILARRALGRNLLWQDMGLKDRNQINLLMARHFRPLAEANHLDMRWKPFFWREIERKAGMDCRTTVQCHQCSHFSRCFGPELDRSPVLQAGIVSA